MPIGSEKMLYMYPLDFEEFLWAKGISIVADAFSKMKKKLYYFHRDSGLEIDFVMNYKNEITLVEVKSKSGKTKSSKTVLENRDKFHVNKCIKLGEYNIGENDKILTLPYYLVFLLKD